MYIYKSWLTFFKAILKSNFVLCLIPAGFFKLPWSYYLSLITMVEIYLFKCNIFSLGRYSDWGQKSQKRQWERRLLGFDLSLSVQVSLLCICITMEILKEINCFVIAFRISASCREHIQERCSENISIALFIMIDVSWCQEQPNTIIVAVGSCRSLILLQFNLGDKFLCNVKQVLLGITFAKEKAAIFFKITMTE